MTDNNLYTPRRFWIIEQRVVGKNAWSPLQREPFESIYDAERWPRRRGFEYRIVELAEAREPILSERINSLPDWARQYIHDIETKCDPAGDVRTITELRDTIRCMEAQAAEAPAQPSPPLVEAYEMLYSRISGAQLKQWFPIDFYKLVKAHRECEAAASPSAEPTKENK